MTFHKGDPGGPGRPRGSRSKINLLLDQLAAENIEEIFGKVMEAARGGDKGSQNIILKRMWSIPRGRPAELDLPPIEKLADLVQAHAAVVAALAAREITPEEAANVIFVLEARRRAFELARPFEEAKALEELKDEIRRLDSRTR